MKQRNRWLSIAILTTSFLVPSYASAQSLELIGEFYSNATLVRVYEDENHQQVTRSFVVPEHLRSQINQSEDATLEAKKVLTVYYTVTNNEENLNGIQNLTDTSGESVPSVRDDFKEKFNTQQEQVTSFVAAEIKKPAVKEEYKDPKTTEVEVPIDVALKDTILEEKTKKEEKVTEPTNEAEKSSDKKSIPWGTIFGTILFISLISGGVIAIIKRR